MVEFIMRNWNKRIIYREINLVKRSLTRYKELREFGYISIALIEDNGIRVEICTESSRWWAEQKTMEDKVKVGTLFKKEEKAENIVEDLAKCAKNKITAYEEYLKQLREKKEKTKEDLNEMIEYEQDVYFLTILMDKIKHPWYNY